MPNTETRTTSLSILATAEGNALLANAYAGVIENVMKGLISGPIKNVELSGDPVAGSLEAKRFANATPKARGTARTAGKGDKVKAPPVIVNIDTDREIVEELADKDVIMFGVDGIIQRRSANHVVAMATDLDTEFFRVAAAAATEVEVDLAGGNVADILETIIQECEGTKNDYVNGVPRAMMHLTLNPAWYGKIRNELDKTAVSNVNTAAEEFNVWHGVRAQSCVNLPAGVPFLLQVQGSVAQPVRAQQYQAEKINLSDDWAVELFYYYGTKAVTPDLIFKPKQKTNQG